MSAARSRLRVGICFGTFPPERNGGSDFVARFAAALAATGVGVHVLTSAGAEAASEALPDGVTVDRIVDDWTLPHGRASLRRVNAALRENDVDLVHIFFPESTIQARYQLPPAIGFRNVPLVTTWWNLGLGRRSPLQLRLTSAALLLRSRVLSSHDPGYLAALRRLSAGRKPVRWLPVGSNFAAAPRAAAGRPPYTLGYFGQLDFTRGVDTLFEALARLGRCDLRLVMIGSAGRPERYADDPAAASEFQRLRRLPEELGVADLVEWTGFLADDEVPAALAALDLCVLPYRRNSLGRSALAAALAAGAPVVLGGRPDLVRPLEPGADVELVPPDDPAALAAAIARLLDDAAARERLATGARAAASHFAWPAIAERAVGLYEEALG